MKWCSRPTFPNCRQGYRVSEVVLAAFPSLARLSIPVPEFESLHEKRTYHFRFTRKLHSNGKRSGWFKSFVVPLPACRKNLDKIRNYDERKPHESPLTLCASLRGQRCIAAIEPRQFFFGHRPNLFSHDRKKLSQFSHNVLKYRLLNTVTASSNTTMGQMTEMSQNKWPKCLKTNDRNVLTKKAGAMA